MNSDLSRYLADFEMKMYIVLEEKCRSMNVLAVGTIQSSEDIDMWWKENAPHYMEDAIREFNRYPSVVIAWAGFLGMAIAQYWDMDWDKYQKRGYKSFYGKEGFDDMDENIIQNILGYPLKSDLGIRIAEVMRSLSHEAINMIRHENVEHGTEKAFHVLVRTLRCMFRIGAAIRLHTLGYKWTKVEEL